MTFCGTTERIGEEGLPALQVRCRTKSDGGWSSPSAVSLVGINRFRSNDGQGR